METERFFLVLSFSFSVFSALFCIILLLMKMAGESLDKFVKRIVLLLIVAYTAEIIYLLAIFFYNFSREIFVYFKVLHFFAMLFMSVLFYHFIFKLTRLQTTERFTLWHYAVPSVLTFLYAVSFSVAPEELRSNTYAKSLKWIKGYELFTILDYGRFYIRVAVSLIYFYLSLKRVIHYRNEIVQYSSDIEGTSLTWLYQIFGVTLLVFIFPILYYILPEEIYGRYFGFIIPNLLVLIFNVVICYNIFRQNFVLLTEDVILDKLTDPEREGKDYLNHEEVHKYMLEEKPYLDPHLKITDLISVFATNRTYLSAFINSTYGLNFSMYINRFRLEEFYRLKNLPENKNVELGELVYLSGFRSTQSLKRSEKILRANKNKELLLS